MRSPTKSETQHSGFEQAFQMLLTHRQDQEPLAWKPRCFSPALGPHHPGHTYLDITQVYYTPSDRCSQEVLDVNGILINDSYFHCNEAAGYLKKPHRESFHHIKELLQGENSSCVSCPTSPKVFYKFCLCVRFSLNGVYLYVNKTSRQHAIRMADSLQNTSGTPAI